jgi:hypothetical protein
MLIVAGEAVSGAAERTTVASRLAFTRLRLNREIASGFLGKMQDERNNAELIAASPVGT